MEIKVSAQEEPKKVPSELELRIRNFRSIRDARFRLRPGLNVLVGPNGSGKTNILCALKFIRDILTSGVALAMGKAGGAPKNYYRGSHEITIEIGGHYDHCRFRGSTVPIKFIWTTVIAQSRPEQIASITRERFRLIATTEVGYPKTILDCIIQRPFGRKPHTRTSLLHESILGKDLFKRLDGKPYSGSKAELFKQVRSQLAKLLRESKKSSNFFFLPSLIEMHPRVFELGRQLSLLHEYNIQPEAARKSTDQVPEARMEADGSGLSEVVHALLQDEWHRIAHRTFYYDPSESYYFRTHIYLRPRHGLEFSDWNRHFLYYRRKGKEQFREALPNIVEHLTTAVNSVESVTTQIDPTNGRRFVVFHAGNNKFLPDEVSDGTIKWLCLLVSLFVPFSRTYLLEEPENFMHPWMQQRLVQIMREQAIKEKLMFIVSTHSSTILNTVQPQELLLINYSKRSTHVSSFEDTEEVEQFLSKSHFGLGDLWVSGGIGAVPRGRT